MVPPAPIRVLYLTDNPNLGGTVRILQSWLLVGRRHGSVHGVAVVPPGSRFGDWLRDHDVPVLTDSSPIPNKRWPLPALWHAWKVAQWARRHRVAIIHCNEHNIYPFAVLLRRFTSLPLVCHVRYQFERPYALWAFGGATREPDALLWTSQQQREDCAAAIHEVVPESKQYLVPLGVDLAVFGGRTATRAPTRTAWGGSDDDVVIGQVCAIRPRKRIVDFVDLVATLAKDHPHVRGILAGDAPPGDESYRDEVVAHIERSGLGTRFRWLGNVDDVEPIDHGIDIFVSTSEYETFGNSICEAMACGCPVVGYRGGSVHEVVGDAGSIVPDRDLPALTEMTRRLVLDPALRQELGERGRQRVIERFSPEATLATLVDLYRTLIAHRE